MGKHLYDSSGRQKKTKLIFRLAVPMLTLVLLQLFVFFAVLIAGGEFTSIKQYVYNTLDEKTGNRKDYIETEWKQKMPAVQETAGRINRLAKEILTEEGKTFADLQKDPDLNRLILSGSVDHLVNMMRRSTASDVFLILDTGDLYAENGSDALAAIYLRGQDRTVEADYHDLLMAVGYSAIAYEYGMSMDSDWKLRFEPDPDDPENYDYYMKTMQTAQENSGLPLQYLGYWSGFSSVSPGGTSSMKYTLPLIAEDGTVYGVLGIGKTENAIISDLLIDDFQQQSACYVLARGKRGSETFDIITHSGVSADSAYNWLVGSEATELIVGKTLHQNICTFELASGIASAGSVRPIEIYDQNSPYKGEQWVLISVAERTDILQPFTFLIQILLTSAIISLAVSIGIMILSTRKIVKPISDAIQEMNREQAYSKVLHFTPSNIYEIDKMTDAITQLQVNVQEFSSQVSKMISIANVGIGTFMYDRTDDSVYVGQSMLEMMNTRQHPDEDILMSRRAFLEQIAENETRRIIAENLSSVPKEKESDFVREYSVDQPDGSTVWLRLSIVHNKTKSIGILQDITSMIMEKKRIEYERDYDLTTGLLNRRAYYRQIEELFCHPERMRVTAFIMLDLDNLKYVNDTYGHDFGEDYIRAAATALKTFQNYGGLVARLSGDEFNVCLPGFESKEDARKVIDEVRQKLLTSCCLLADGTQYRVRASAGVAWYPDDADTRELLFKYADFAMYTVKHASKGEIAEFDKETYEKDSVLLNGIEEMNRIIDERKIQYAFHTIVSATTGEVYGYEALLRPQSDTLHSPEALLRIAKSGAKLYEIEYMTWTRALESFQNHMLAGRVSKDSHVFINSISNCALESADVDRLEQKYAAVLSNVVLEILESEKSNEEYNERKIKRMQKWNAQIALDDFGSGYNSEYALITVNPNLIKIDRSIITGCDRDFSRRSIIRNLVKLVKSRKIMVLAEGVETEQELRTVISCGVDLIQGYFVCKPVFEPEPIKPEVIAAIQHYAKLAGR